MLELYGILPVRRPDGSRWKDESLFRFAVHLVDAEADYAGTEEASIEEIQAYDRFQCFVAREFGVWFRYPPAEAHETGHQAWSELVAKSWGRGWPEETPVGAGDDAAVAGGEYAPELGDEELP